MNAGKSQTHSFRVSLVDFCLAPTQLYRMTEHGLVPDNAAVESARGHVALTPSDAAPAWGHASALPPSTCSPFTAAHGFALHGMLPGDAVRLPLEQLPVVATALLQGCRLTKEGRVLSPERVLCGWVREWLCLCVNLSTPWWAHETHTWCVARSGTI